MIGERHRRLVEYLSETSGWVTAGELSQWLGVSSRSIRSYVTALKEEAAPFRLIEAGASGYRLDREAYARYRQGRRPSEPSPDGPEIRHFRVAARLVDEPLGVDLHALTQEFFVSESTMEGDLRRARPVLERFGLELARVGSRFVVAGIEQDRRRMLAAVFLTLTSSETIDLERVATRFGLGPLGPAKSQLLARLAEADLHINEFALDAVILTIAVAAHRVHRGYLLDEAPANADPRIRSILVAALTRVLRTPLPALELDALAVLVAAETSARADDEHAAEADRSDSERMLALLVADVVQRASREYLIDLDDDVFVDRLSRHVIRVVRRGPALHAPNPMTRSLKAAYPSVYELAVYIATAIQHQTGIEIDDSEITNLALHIGAFLEQRSAEPAKLTCTFVCPDYYGMHLLLRDRIEQVFGHDLDVTHVITRSDVDWDSLDTDLVLTTLEPRSPSDRVLHIQPFLGDADVERIRTAVARMRRHTRRASMRGQLLRYFDADLYFRNLPGDDEADIIRTLGDAMVRVGVIDEGYVAGALERERMSSTAFTDTIAVPHAMSMSATRTTIAVAVNDAALRWGENRVSVVAMIAFSESDREQFQPFFDQFVEVFSSRGNVARVLAGARDFASFIEVLARLMDD